MMPQVTANQSKHSNSPQITPKHLKSDRKSPHITEKLTANHRKLPPKHRQADHKSPQITPIHRSS